MPSPSTPKPKGFTILELVVVAGILAVISGLVIVNFRGNEVRAERQVAFENMVRIKEALLRFKLETGSFPNDGDLVRSNLDMSRIVNEVGIGEAVSAGSPTGREWFARTDIGSTPARLRAWAPTLDELSELGNGSGLSNLWMLFEQPFRPSTAANSQGVNALEWSRSTGRGWNGPYIREQRQARFDPDGLSVDGVGGFFAFSDNIRIPASRSQGQWFAPVQAPAPGQPRRSVLLEESELDGSPITFHKTDLGYYLRSLGENGKAEAVDAPASQIDDLWVFVAPLDPLLNPPVDPNNDPNIVAVTELDAGPPLSLIQNQFSRKTN